jgi:flagellin-like hook-associated protein FlgL
MALEMTKNIQYGIITQAGIAILGQANARPQQILQLLN